MGKTTTSFADILWQKTLQKPPPNPDAPKPQDKGALDTGGDKPSTPQPKPTPQAQAPDGVMSEADRASKGLPPGDRDRNPFDPIEEPKEQPKSDNAAGADAGTGGGPPAKTDDKPKSDASSAPQDDKPKRVKRVAVREPTAASPHPQIDAEKIAEAAARGVSSALRESPKPAPDTTGIPKEVLENAPLYSELEQLQPKKYGQLNDRMVQFARDEDEYAKRWESQNPGKAFDPDNEEHAAWYSSHEPQVDPADIIRAQARIDMRKEIGDSVSPKMREMEMAVKRQELGAESDKAARRVTDVVALAAVGGDIKRVTKEEIVKLQEDDPISFDTAVEVEAKYSAAASAAVLLWNGAANLDKTNEGHALALAAFESLETKLSSLPQESLPRKEGKTWVPYGQFQRMTPQVKATHYTTELSDVTEYLERNAEVDFQNLRENRKKLAARYQKSLGTSNGTDNASNSSRPKETPGKTKAPEKPAKAADTESPSVGAGDSPNAGAPTNPGANNRPRNLIWDRLFPG